MWGGLVGENVFLCWEWFSVRWLLEVMFVILQPIGRVVCIPRPLCGRECVMAWAPLTMPPFTCTGSATVMSHSLPRCRADMTSMQRMLSTSKGFVSASARGLVSG